MKDFDENMLMKKITSGNLEGKGVVFDQINKALENEGVFYYFVLDFFGYEWDSSKVNKNEAWKMSAAISQFANLSSVYCNQKISRGKINILF